MEGEFLAVKSRCDSVQDEMGSSGGLGKSALSLGWHHGSSPEPHHQPTPLPSFAFLPQSLAADATTIPVSASQGSFFLLENPWLRLFPLSLGLFCKIGIVRLAHDCTDVAGCLRTAERWDGKLVPGKRGGRGKRPGKTRDFLQPLGLIGALR